MTDAKLTIRPITAADAGALGDFFELLAADPETERFFHPHPMTRAYAESLCVRAGICKDGYFVARYGGPIVGYSLLRGWEEGYAIPSWGGCVHPELRGAGLGQFLLVHGINASRAKGAPKVRLTVFKANTAAIHVYRKYGFTFQDKAESLCVRNEKELIGLLDLTNGATPPAARVNLARLDDWLAGELRQAPFAA